MSLTQLSAMRSPNRLHDRASFFKYMPADTAKKVLANRTLRWSSPLEFNDPFDVPREFLEGVTSKELSAAARKYVRSLIENPPNDTSFLYPRLRQLIDLVKREISQELREEMMQEALVEDAVMLSPGTSLDELKEIWRRLLPQYRLLCLTESPGHAAMWYHYADKYTGAVLEFGCNDALDSPWLIARPITYPEALPAIYHSDGYAKLLSMNKEAQPQILMDIATLTKSPDWSYEKEWRVVSFRDKDDEGLTSDIPFNAEELLHVYCGPRMSSTDRQDIDRLASAYPNARMINVAIGMKREFIFTEA